MTRPYAAAEFALPRVAVVDGLPDAIDVVAEAGPPTHAFLRRGWFAAALAAYGGAARTVLMPGGLALPLVPVGPRLLGIAGVMGSWWPFRSFPCADPAACGEALAAVATTWRAIRIGPVYDGDPSAAPLVEAARAGGWAVINRIVAQSFLLDIAAQSADGPWPRNSTLRKNRFHEKHLAAHGALDWRMIDDGDWPAAFDLLAEVERASWHAGASDPKFARGRHAAFWRAAAADPGVAAMLHAALLTVDGRPAAFSFDLDAGEVRYAIANSYDPAYAKHSPGKLLYWRNLVDGVARGVTKVDWGAGDSGYKQVIGATEGPLIRDWLLIRPGALATLAGLLRRA